MRSLPTLLCLVALFAVAPSSPRAQDADHDDHDDHVTHVGEVELLHAWARATDEPLGAMFVEIINEGAEPVTLVGGSSDMAEEIAVHGAVMQDGVMTTEPLGPLRVAPNSRMEMAPDAVMLRLTGLQQTLEEGARFPVILLFEDGLSAEVSVMVEAADALEHSHAGHAH